MWNYGLERPAVKECGGYFVFIYNFEGILIIMGMSDFMHLLEIVILQQGF